MTSGIYWMYQISRDRAVYVGSSQNIAKRIVHHRHVLRHGHHSNSHVQRTWDKYGEADFQFIVLEECAIEHLIEREQFWTDALSPACYFGQCVEAPFRGRKQTDEVKQKVSLSQMGNQTNKGRSRTVDQRKHLSDAMTGRKRTKEARLKQSAATKGRKKPPFSDEHRKHMSEAATRRYDRVRALRRQMEDELSLVEAILNRERKP